MDKDLIKLRDLFRESADIIDEMLELERREANGEEVTKEVESVAGRFMIKMVEISNCSE